MNTGKRLKEYIASGKAVLGIELGSTRIKAVLIDEEKSPVASGSYDWENQYIDHIWTYSEAEIWKGLQECYRDLVRDIRQKYDVEADSFAAIGISGMMHGYLAFDSEDQMLVPFRTWRNTMTEAASEKLSELFDFHIPQRWSIAHLYQAILNEEKHVPEITYMTTLSGYIHWKLTGKKVLGNGDVSGMFPIDISTKDYNKTMLEQFDELVSDKGYAWKVEDILPKALVAGDDAGCLTEEGARLLDPTGRLKAGIPMCPPEGDAGTGMTATNSVAVRTGNVSAGTSVFAMAVLEKDLTRPYEEIDLVTTPAGDLVAMVHCNNCTSDLNAWVGLFKEFTECLGIKPDMNRIFSLLYNKALEGDPDCGGLLAYNYLSGEHITGFNEGRPLFVRTPESRLNLANFMRTHLYTCLGALKTGMDILLKQEDVVLDQMLGHGGLFKTKGVAQRILAGAIDTPVCVMETAGEGGAWGIALLADYMIRKAEGESLASYLENKVFQRAEGTVIEPQPEDVAGYERFMKVYQSGLPIERAAVECLNAE